ncbi:MAG: 4-alpha-glucanotransferase [Gammaproteobacteria bacterium]|nr:4-alpha-glucanotransferase [Gammaproteobacteria bacterium]
MKASNSKSRDIADGVGSRKGVDGQILPSGRRAGVSLHITSLPGRYGIGEIGGEALAFVDTMKRMELSVWQFLPLGPTAYLDSPYQPLSTFAGNEMLIDVEDLIQCGLLSRNEAGSLTDLPTEYVDYGALIPLKSTLLRAAAGRFKTRADSDLKAGFDRFLEQHDDDWLHEYALFRVLKSQHGERPWPQWQPEFVHHDDAALKRLENQCAAHIIEIKVNQFLFHHQWQRLRNVAREANVCLFGDLPICIALDSADAWANREILRIDRDGHPDHVAGVPPDFFSTDGQLWGNPLYDWETHKATDYRWWIDRLRASAELADIVRIDHFRGFEAYWSVPANADTARNGTWEPGPGDAIFVAMKNALGVLPIVAEDLGVITPEVEALRDRHQIPGMVVLQFDVRHEDFRLADVPENCVCYTGTHDNDTTLGWFRGSPDDTRSTKEIKATQHAVRKLTGGSDATIAMDFVKAAFSTAARIAIAPMQDYLELGSEARINIPGTSSNNWRWRVTEAQLTNDLCDNVADTVRAANRELRNDHVDTKR